MVDPKLISAGVESVVVSLPHRGRLSMLCDPDLLGYSPTALFSKIKGNPEFGPETAPGATGDVISHLSAIRKIPYDNGIVKVEVLQNPSHLEVSRDHLPGLIEGCQSCRVGCDEGEANVIAEVIAEGMSIR